MNNKLEYDLAQDWHAFKRYASTIIDVDSEGKWINKLEQIKDEGTRLVKDYNEWWMGRLIIQGLKSAIGDHGSITMILIPSALKRIMGKIKEWRKKHDRKPNSNINQSLQRNRVFIQRTQEGLFNRPDSRAASG